MNNEGMKLLTNTKYDAAKPVSPLNHAKVNSLLIGRHNSWMTNARAIHKDHFVGTRCAAGPTGRACNV